MSAATVTPQKTPLVAGIEAGGTKFVIAVGTGPGAELLARTRIEVGEPGPTLAATVDWFSRQQEQFGPLAALGVASFGPLDLRGDSPTYGRLLKTPKPGWTGVDLLAPLRAVFGETPIGLDTDVNGAALGERTWGAAQGLDDFVYVTMGTGIGGGGMSGGRLLHGLIHPEMGHLRLPREPGDDFAGVCPFHGDCWEGLCCGPALAARTGQHAEDLPADHPAWQFVAQSTGAALANLVVTLSPRRIILGGSVPKGGRLGSTEFFRRVRQALGDRLAGYIVAEELTTDAGLAAFVVPPALGDDAGVCGALALARKVAPAR